MSDTQNSEKVRGKPFTGKDDPRRNNGGRPKGYNSFRKKFRGKERNDAMREELWAIISDQSQKASDRLNAMRLWWEYGWGKTPAAPDDNDALRESGSERLPFTREEMLAELRGEKGSGK